MPKCFLKWLSLKVLVSLYPLQHLLFCLFYSHPCGYEVIFNSHFPVTGWLFLYVYWSFIYFLCWNDCSSLLPILKWFISFLIIEFCFAAVLFFSPILLSSFVIWWYFLGGDMLWFFSLYLLCTYYRFVFFFFVIISRLA